VSGIVSSVLARNWKTNCRVVNLRDGFVLGKPIILPSTSQNTKDSEARRRLENFLGSFSVGFLFLTTIRELKSVPVFKVEPAFLGRIRGASLYLRITFNQPKS
jgi:hypothetical protein